MNEGRSICSRCGKPVPRDVPLGLCPECLIRSAMGTEPDPAKAGFVPPAVSELARLLPQFEIISLIGQGGMGAVYKARQPALDRLVALKILPSHAAEDPGFAERFSREARALARLNHPNIVAVYDSGQAGNLGFLLMEFVDGANLRELRRTRQIAPQEALQIIPQICDALQFAHGEGIVHRDIKPENILLDKKGRVKITDFGIAKIVSPTPEKIGLTEMRDVLGTPHYMAPEQLEQPGSVDYRADIFSLGVVFYELLTGELPLGKFAPPSQKVRVDVRLDSVVLRALEKEPERRYQRASDVKTDVQAIAATPPPIPKSQLLPIARPDPPNPRPGQGRLWLVVGAGAAALLLLLVLAVPALFLLTRESSARKKAATAFSPVTSPVIGTGAPGQLHYNWKTGAVLTYAVKVATTNENYSETVSGNITYTVRSVDGDRATISCLSHLGLPLRLPKPGRALPMSFPRSFGDFWPGPAFGSPAREVQVDGTGKILSRSGNSHSLPQALGEMEGLIFEALPAQQADHWETRGDCEIRETRLVPLAPNSHFGHEQETMLPSKETSQYEIVSRSGTTVVIDKRYELMTDETVAGQPRIKLAGQGTIQFDVAAGLPEAMDFQGTLTESGENATYRIPLTLSYRHVANATNQPALLSSGISNAPPAELTAAQIDELLIDLKSTAPGRQQIAADRLAATKPGAPHDAVETQLLAMLASPDWPARQSAANALGNWGSPKAVEPLVKLLDDSVFSVRWAAVDSLGRLHDERALDPLAKHFAAGVDIAQTSTALERFGTAAEEPVIKLLASKNPEVRYAACRLLAVIGTKASLPALTAAASDSDGIVALLAKDALRTIETRR